MPAIPAIITAAATVGGTVAASKINSGATGRAAREQTSAANYAADVQERSAREALEYQRQQAAEDARRYEIDRRANYEQWAAREGRLGALASQWGMGARPIPAYVPSGVETNTASGPNDPRIADVFNRVTAGGTLAPTSENLNVLIDEFKKAGIDATRATHAGNQPSEDFINFGGGGGYDFIQNVGSPNARWQMLAGRGTAAAAAPMGGSLRDLARRQPPPVAPAVAPTAYVAPSTLRALARRR